MKVFVNGEYVGTYDDENFAIGFLQMCRREKPWNVVLQKRDGTTVSTFTLPPNV